MNTTPFHAAILKSIADIQEEKRQNLKFPDHVLIQPDMLYGRVALLGGKDDFNKAMNELKDAGLIHIGPTANKGDYARLTTNRIINSEL